MNNDNHPMDERLLKQVDERLEYAKPSDYSIINTLAETLALNSTSQADATFMNGLEERLVAQLQQRHREENDTTMFTMMTKPPQRVPTVSYLTWAAALIVIVLMGGYLLTQTQSPRPTLPQSAVQVPTAVPMHTVVIATENITAGTTITDDMVGVINLSAVDFDKLQSSQPQHTFLTDTKQVVGQTATAAVSWFQPFEQTKLGKPPGCSRTILQCVATPEGTYTISLPLPMIRLDTLGLAAGDRVDILASENNQLTVVVEDVLLAQVQIDKITFAATSWKLGVLIWFWQSKQPYSLSRHRDEAPARDETPTHYSFTSPEALPDNYKFDLIVGLPDSQGYQLIGAPYSLDTIHFTQRDTRMQFWFTKLDVVSITGGTKVEIRLPTSDAALLDFLLKNGATLEFVPQ